MDASLIQVELALLRLRQDFQMLLANQLWTSHLFDGCGKVEKNSLVCANCNWMQFPLEQNSIGMQFTLVQNFVGKEVASEHNFQ